MLLCCLHRPVICSIYVIYARVYYLHHGFFTKCINIVMASRCLLIKIDGVMCMGCVDIPSNNWRATVSSSSLIGYCDSCNFVRNSSELSTSRSLNYIVPTQHIVSRATPSQGDREVVSSLGRHCEAGFPASFTMVTSVGTFSFSGETSAMWQNPHQTSMFPNDGSLEAEHM